MTTVDPQSGVASSPAAIESDTPCIRCGYNLRGLDTVRQCPECGEQVAISMRGRSLSVADRNWITRITVGATLAGASMPVFFALMYCLTALYLQSPIPLHLVIAVVFAGGGCGLWLVTAREPGGPYFDSHSFLRRFLRVVGALAGLAGVAFALLEFVLAYDWGWDLSWRIQSYMGLVAFPCGLIALMALLPRYLGVLARRLPGKRLARHGTLAMLSFPAMVAAYITIALIASFFRRYLGQSISIAVSLVVLTMFAWPSVYSVAWSAIVYRAVRKVKA